jgi:hypothetical protein
MLSDISTTIFFMLPKAIADLSAGAASAAGGHTGQQRPRLTEEAME